MNERTTHDMLHQEVSVGAAVAVLTAGNFIYGHVISIFEDGKAEIVPDLGHISNKPNFRLKKSYKVSPKHFTMLANQEKFTIKAC